MPCFSNGTFPVIYHRGTVINNRKRRACHTEKDSKSFQIKQNLDCNYTFPVDLAPTEMMFGAKTIGKR